MLQSVVSADLQNPIKRTDSVVFMEFCSHCDERKRFWPRLSAAVWVTHPTDPAAWASICKAQLDLERLAIEFMQLINHLQRRYKAGLDTRIRDVD